MSWTPDEKMKLSTKMSCETISEKSKEREREREEKSDLVDDDDNDVLMREGPLKEIINNGQRVQIANALRPIESVGSRSFV